VWTFVIRRLEPQEFILPFDSLQAVQCTEADLEVLINKSKIFIYFQILTTKKNNWGYSKGRARTQSCRVTLEAMLYDLVICVIYVIYLVLRGRQTATDVQGQVHVVKLGVVLPRGRQT
jgi:hypothetical protein